MFALLVELSHGDVEEEVNALVSKGMLVFVSVLGYLRTDGHHLVDLLPKRVDLNLLKCFDCAA